MPNRRISTSALSLVLVALACSDSVAPPEAKTIEANSPTSSLAAFVGMPVGDDPEVLVRDGNGLPISGISVKFTVTGGGGTVTNATTVSGPQGRATAGLWTLGPAVGFNTLVGSVDGVGSVQFTAQAVLIPTGTFHLATVDGQPLPYTDLSSSSKVVGGTITLGSNRAFRYVVRTSSLDGAIVYDTEVAGEFASNGATNLHFYVDGWIWTDGAVQGDLLKTTFWDISDFLHTYIFTREAAP